MSIITASTRNGVDVSETIASVVYGCALAVPQTAATPTPIRTSTALRLKRPRANR